MEELWKSVPSLKNDWWPFVRTVEQVRWSSFDEAVLVFEQLRAASGSFEQFRTCPGFEDMHVCLVGLLVGLFVWFVCLFVCVFVCLFVCLFACLFVWLLFGLRANVWNARE